MNMKSLYQWFVDKYVSIERNARNQEITFSTSKLILDFSIKRLKRANESPHMKRALIDTLKYKYPQYANSIDKAQREIIPEINEENLSNECLSVAEVEEIKARISSILPKNKSNFRSGNNSIKNRDR